MNIKKILNIFKQKSILSMTPKGECFLNYLKEKTYNKDLVLIESYENELNMLKIEIGFNNRSYIMSENDIIEEVIDNLEMMRNGKYEVNV